MYLLTDYYESNRVREKVVINTQKKKEKVYLVPRKLVRQLVNEWKTVPIRSHKSGALICESKALRCICTYAIGAMLQFQHFCSICVSLDW